MKILSYFFLCTALFLLTNCSEEEWANQLAVLCDGNIKTIALPNGDMLTVPECFEHVVLQGTDSSVGELVSVELGITFSMV